MKLRRLSVTGFKTFARRSEITFDPGITAVVGPNGSGKSNIVDAIRWALGETNARELRGARMEEVIYSGGNKRGRMNVAEIELVLDNSQSEVASEDTEVAVGRRVSRSGESEYRLNGDRVRLRDLEHVLGQTGLTQSGYSVVAQNDIDGIIQATPIQRRSLVEQAAGIRALRAASQDALERVTQAEQNLQRMEDLLADAEPRLAELAAQAELALEQRELTDRLSELRGNLAREEWRAARGQLRSAKRRLEAAQRRAEAAAEAAQGFSSRFTAQRDEVTLIRESQRNAMSHLEAARLGAERAAGEARRWGDRSAAAVLQRAAAVAEAAAAAAEETASAAELGQLTDSADSLSMAVRATESRLGAAREGHAGAVAALAAVDGEMGALERSVEELSRLHEAAGARARDAQARCALLQEAVQSQTRELAVVSDRLHGMEQEATRLATEAAVQAEQERASQTLLETARTDAAELRRQLEGAQAQLSAARTAAQAAATRAAALRGQLEGAVGGADGALAAAVSEGRITARRLVDCFTVRDAAMTRAVEAVLQPHLGAWVTTQMESAAAAMASSPARESAYRAGPAQALAPVPAGVTAVMDLIEVTDSSAAQALSHLLHSVWLAADMPSARRVLSEGDGTVVLPDGCAVSRLGITGGAETHTLELAETEHAAAAEAARALNSEAAAAAQTEQVTVACRGAEETLTGATEAAQAARLTATETRTLAAAATAAVTAEAQHRAGLEASQAARRQELAQLGSAAAAAATDAGGSVALLEAARAALTQMQQSRTEQRGALEHALDELHLADSEATELRLRGDDLDRHRRALTEALAAAGRRRAAAQIRVLSAEGEALVALVRGRRASATGAQSAARVSEAQVTVAEAAPRLEAAERLLTALDQERSEIAVVAARASDEVEAATQETAMAQTRVEELADAVRGDDDDEGPEPDAQAAERAEREIVRLERRIAAMGPVNGLAPDQHAVLFSRVDVLRRNRGDIRGGCTDVRAMAARLETEMQRRFDTVFLQVAEHFQELYSELFPGGRATLRLEPTAPEVEATDEAEPTPARAARLAGVEILAQPAGKRLQPLSLFSGGERALTALAVILALQRVSPSPFYVFDEIDAPLDDANVVRFTRLLSRLAVEQQFIVVTHNHVTMAAANVLYGVTIDSEGVSSVLSVRLQAAEELAEREVVGRRTDLPVATPA